MVIDLNLVKEVWNGSIPARFTLASHEICGAGKPPPCYLMLQRNSYLSLIMDKIKKHFMAFIDESNSGDIWFDFGGSPLKWHYPVGVLCDLLWFNQQSAAMEITVHFQDFPNENLIRLHHTDAIESIFMSMLKEADYLKHRGQVINNMNKNQHKQLWNSLRNNNFEQFWAVNSKLMERHAGDAGFKYIPLRIYCQDKLFQHLVSPDDGDSKELTLQKFIENVHLPVKDCKSFQAIVQGINLPMNSPLQWLSENLSSADNFLHVVVLLDCA